MIVKVLPKHGTTMHVHDKKKYYPGEVKGVDDELGKLLVKMKIVEQLPGPPKRGPGRPRKGFGG